MTARDPVEVVAKALLSAWLRPLHERAPVVVDALCDAGLLRDHERERAAREKGLREAALTVDCGCRQREKVLTIMRDAGERIARRECPHSDVCCALQAAAILALLKKEGT